MITKFSIGRVIWSYVNEKSRVWNGQWSIRDQPLYWEFERFHFWIAFSDFFPNLLNAVHLRRIWLNKNKTNVFRNNQSFLEQAGWHTEHSRPLLLSSLLRVPFCSQLHNTKTHFCTFILVFLSCFFIISKSLAVNVYFLVIVLSPYTLDHTFLNNKSFYLRIV